MPALRCTALATRALASAALTAQALGAEGEQPEPGPFDHLLPVLDFSTGPSDVEDRGFTVGRAPSWAILEVTGGALRCEALLGGGDGSNAGDDLTRSWRFGLNAGFERLGNGCFVEIGPDAPTPTPVDFDARVRLVATNAAEDGPVAEGDPGQWCFGVFYFEGAESAGGCPNSTHAGIGVDGDTAQRVIEVKNTVDSVSTYPVTDQDVLEGDIRCVRVGQLFEWSWRPATSGEPLESDEDWTVLQLIDRSANPISETGHLGASVYGGPESLADLHLAVLAWTVTEA